MKGRVNKNKILEEKLREQNEKISQLQEQVDSNSSANKEVKSSNSKKKIEIYKDTTKSISDYPDRNKNPDDLLIQIRDIKKSYSKKEQVLKGINLDIYKGDRLAIMGHNGSGKTTLSNIILGYFPPNEGSIHLEGSESTRDFLRKVGIQFQKSNYFRNWKIDDAIDFTMKLSLQRDSEQSYKDWFYNEARPLKEELIKFFMLDKVRETKINKLSGGEQQKLNLILSLIKRPEILILDEFTTGLDITFKEKTIDYLDKYITKNNITLIVISHIKEEVERLADRIVLIDDGVIKNDVMMKEILEQNADLSRYLNHYFVNGEIIEEFKPSEKMTETKEDSTKYEWGYYKPENPFKSIDASKDTPLKTDFLGKAIVKKTESTKLVDNSIKAYNKLLFGDWLKTGGWILPAILFFVILLIFPIGIAAASVESSNLESKLASIASVIGIASSMSLVMIWGYLIFKVKGTMTLKRIDISNSSKNSFVSYALLTSLFWYFIPLFIMLTIVTIFINTGVLFSGVVSQDAILISPITATVTEGIEWGVVGDSTDWLINVPIAFDVNSSSIDWGLFFYSSILNYLVTLGVIFMILSFVKTSPGVFWVSSLIYFAIVMILSTAVMSPDVLLGEQNPYEVYIQTPGGELINVTHFDTGNGEVGTIVNNDYIKATPNSEYYSYSSTLATLSTALIIPGAINLMGLSFMAMGPYTGTDMQSFVVINSLVPLFASIGAIGFGLSRVSRWTA